MSTHRGEWILVFISFCQAAANIVVAPSGDLTRPLGAALVLSCEVLELPEHTLCPVWISPAGDEIWDTEGRLYVEGYGRTLVKLYFTRVEPSDAGLWQCQTTTPGNETIQDAVPLQIYQDVAFVRSSRSQILTQGQDGLLRCKASGHPVPTITWRFKGNRIDNDDRHVQEAEGLRILGARRADRGNYTCRAEVSASGHVAFMDIYVTVRAKPFAMLITSNARGHHRTSYKLTWRDTERDPDALPLTMYKIKYRELSIGQGGVITQHGPWIKKVIHLDPDEHDVSHYTLDNLIPGTFYGIQLKAKNRLGWGPRTAKFAFKTAPS